ncbi:MAG: glycosyltransferase family A protein [Gilvibacter sp.]
MRIGVNPEKQEPTLHIESYHRVVIPVYIPNLEEDYFKDGLVVLKLCLESLFATIHSKTKVSLIDNGCCNEVRAYLSELYNTNDTVDQLLLSKINLGKVNALYSAIKSNLEPLITIADSDVMFLPSWQQEVEQLHYDFPEAGLVSPVPSSTAFASPFNKSTLFYGFFKAKIKAAKVQDPDGMIKFQDSIGREMYSKNHLEQYLTISNKKSQAVIGSGHFVATLKAQVFRNAPEEICQAKIVGGSENKYIDVPNDKGGFLRLSTMGNFAYHLGNQAEDWMHKRMEQICNEAIDNPILPELPAVKPISGFGYWMGGVIRKIFFVKLKKSYLKAKGIKQPY